MFSFLPEKRCNQRNRQHRRPKQGRNQWINESECMLNQVNSGLNFLKGICSFKVLQKFMTFLLLTCFQHLYRFLLIPLLPLLFMMINSCLMHSMWVFLKENLISYGQPIFLNLRQQHLLAPQISVTVMGDESRAKADLKKLIREAIEENEIEKAASSTSVATAKAKSKSKVILDPLRTQGPDQRDPRHLDTTWPCQGLHQCKGFNNRWGAWKECVKCGFRTEYTPAQNAPAQTLKSDLPATVTEALHRLRSEGWTAEELDARTVKAMITMVSKEKVIYGQKGYKANAKPKATTPSPAKVEVEDDDLDGMEVAQEPAAKK